MLTSLSDLLLQEIVYEAWHPSRNQNVPQAIVVVCGVHLEYHLLFQEFLYQMVASFLPTLKLISFV